MALSIREPVKSWGVALLVIFLALWLLGAVTLRAIVGGALADFLGPVADRLQRQRLSRVGTTALITLIAAAPAATRNISPPPAA